MPEFDVNEFVTAQHTLNIEMSKSLARIEQSQLDTTRRLFGGDGQVGVLPYMAKQAESVAETVNTRIEGVEKRTAKLEIWKSGTLKWIGGVVAVLSTEGVLVAFYFNHVAGKVQEIQTLLKR